MALWQRLLATLIAIIVTSLIAGLIWHSLFNTNLPSYISGLIGGLAALPVWEFSKRIGPKSKS